MGLVMLELLCSLTEHGVVWQWKPVQSLKACNRILCTCLEVLYMHAGNDEAESLSLPWPGIVQEVMALSTGVLF